MNIPQKDLDDYLFKVTSKESPLLKSLREETESASPVARMLCGPIEGQLLAMLVKLSGAKRCLEIGTFTGYSALHIASSLPVDGKLITCELRKDHADIAQRYFDQSPHGHKIELLLGNATETLLTLAPSFDFIFIDADKANYPLYYDLVLPKLKPQGLIVVDNALWDGEVVHPDSKEARAIDSLNQKASQDPLVETVMLTVRDGMLLIRKL
jgi:caffeoyl-CoA O-methyltransferase